MLESGIKQGGDEKSAFLELKRPNMVPVEHGGRATCLTLRPQCALHRFCNEKGWINVSTKRFVLFLFLVCSVALNSCSKRSRARRSLKASEEIYLDARRALLSGDVKKALERAEISLSHVQKADKLVPFEERDRASSMQIEMIRTLVAAFQDPSGAVRLWLHSRVREDEELATYLIDSQRTWREAEAESKRQFPENQATLAEKTLRETIQETLDKQIGTLLGEEDAFGEKALFGETAQVMLPAEDKGGREIALWLHRQEGIWRIYDLGLGEQRCTEVLGQVLSVIGNEVDWVEALREGSLCEGLAVLCQNVSSAAYERSKTALLTGDPEEAFSLAERSVAFGEKADSMAGFGGFDTGSSEQKVACKVFAAAFQDPAEAVNLWLKGAAEGEEEMTCFLFDSGRTFAKAFGERQRRAPREDWAELAAAVAESFQRTTRRYTEILSASKPGTSPVSVSGDQATLRYRLELSGESMETKVWLHQEDGIWRIYDISLGQERCSDVVAALASALNGNVDLISFFEDKDLVEALSDLRDAERLERMFETKPMIGQYVRLTKPTTLVRGGGTKEQVKQGTILKVMGQGKNRTGEILVFVRTTEADIKGSAMGAISQESTEPVGSDETELWGVDAVK